jgi:hypothetical protein
MWAMAKTKQSKRARRGSSRFRIKTKFVRSSSPVVGDTESTLARLVAEEYFDHVDSKPEATREDRDPDDDE